MKKAFSLPRGRIFTSCYKCTERHVSCHSECEKYKAEQELNKKIRRTKQLEADLTTLSCQRGQRNEKSKN